jgi:hypothetical protein
MYPKPVRQPMIQPRVYTRVQQENLQRASRGGVVVLISLKSFAQFPKQHIFTFLKINAANKNSMKI